MESITLQDAIKQSNNKQKAIVDEKKPVWKLPEASVTYTTSIEGKNKSETRRETINEGIADITWNFDTKAKHKLVLNRFGKDNIYYDPTRERGEVVVKYWHVITKYLVSKDEGEVKRDLNGNWLNADLSSSKEDEYERGQEIKEKYNNMRQLMLVDNIETYVTTEHGTITFRCDEGADEYNFDEYKRVSCENKSSRAIEVEDSVINCETLSEYLRKIVVNGSEIKEVNDMEYWHLLQENERKRREKGIKKLQTAFNTAVKAWGKLTDKSHIETREKVYEKLVDTLKDLKEAQDFAKEVYTSKEAKALEEVQAENQSFVDKVKEELEKYEQEDVDSKDGTSEKADKTEKDGEESE